MLCKFYVNVCRNYFLANGRTYSIIRLVVTERLSKRVSENNNSLSKTNLFWIIFFVIVAVLSYDFLYSLFYVLVPAEWIEQQELAFIDTLMCMIFLAVYIPIYYFMTTRWLSTRKSFSQAILGKKNSFDSLGGCLLGLAIGGYATFWFMLVDWLTANTNLFPQTVNEFEDIWNFTETETYFYVLMSIAIIGPIVEELLFRGIIYDLIRSNFGPWIAIICSSLMFGYWHMQPVQMGYTVIAGLALGLAREYSGGLIFPMAIHILNNGLSTLPEDWYTWANLPIQLLSLASVILVIPTIKKYLQQIKSESIQSGLQIK